MEGVHILLPAFFKTLIIQLPSLLTIREFRTFSFETYSSSIGEHGSEIRRGVNQSTQWSFWKLYFRSNFGAQRRLPQSLLAVNKIKNVSK